MQNKTPDNDTLPSAAHSYVTSNDAAAMLGVSLRTIQLWSDDGLLKCWKTDGGHRRISRDSINRLLKSRNQSPETDTESSAKPMRILVVEDDLDLLRLYRMQLTKWTLKPEVSYATNGYQGLVVLGFTRPHLLITDLKMPNMSGVQMLKTLRSMPELDNTEIVVVSGIDAQQLTESGEEMPDSVLVLPKPIPFDQLEQIAWRTAETYGCWLPPKNQHAET